MEKARMLKLKEAAEYNRKVIWLEMRETAGMVPVTFYAEHVPFLWFDAEDRVLMIEVRAEYYGKTWRCWNARPDGQTVPDWEDPEEGKTAGAKSAARAAAAGKKTAARKAGAAK